MLEIRRIDNISPQEAQRKLALFSTQLWREQFETNFFIKDIRSDVYLRNEIRAFWEGRISQMHGWTDILGQLGQWILDNVLKPITNAFSVVQKWISDAISNLMKLFDPIWEALRDAISGVAKAIWNFFSPAVSWFLDVLRSIGNTVYNAVSGVATSLWNLLSQGFHWIADNVWKAVSPIATTISSFFSSIASTLTNFANSVYQGILKIPEVITKIPEFFQAVFSWLWDKVLVPFGKTIQDFLGKAVQTIGNIASAIVWQLLSVVTSHSPLTPEEAFNNIKPALMVGGAMLGTLGLSYVIGELAHPLKEIGLGHLAAIIWRASSYDIVTGAIIGAFATAAFGTPLRYYFNALFQPYVPEEKDAINMKFRNIVDDGTYLQIMRYRGYKEDWARKLLEVNRSLPGVQDMVTFAVREAFTISPLPSAPQSFIDAVQLHGLDKKWADMFWWSHWRLPAFDQLAEAFVRGVINASEFNQYIIWQDYAPFSRPGISKSDQQIMNQLIYRLPGRIEARWMMRWGLATKDEISKLMIADRVHPDWIARVVEAEWMNMLTDERTALKNTYVDMYASGKITLDDLRAKLLEQKYDPREADLITKTADWKRTSWINEKRADIALTAYRRGRIDENTLAAELQNAGYTSEMIQGLINIYRTIPKEDIYQTPDEVIRNAGKEVIMSRYKDGCINDKDFEDEMKIFGFTDTDIQRYKLIAQLKRDYDATTEVVSQVKSAYLAKKIGDELFISTLRKYGVTDERIQLELSLLKLRRGFGSGEGAA
jgi:hypothetical protein